jgi:hypothetical protein
MRELANSNVKSRDEAVCYWCWMPWIGKAGILKTRRVELVSILLKRDIFALVKLAANLRHVCSNEVLTLEEWGFRRYFIASQSALHQRNRLRSRRNILLRPVYNTCS